jgi:hypothetical protein
MGFNTPVLILNDAMHGLKTDPEIGSKMYDAILRTQRVLNRGYGVDFSIGNHCNGGHALASEHADHVQIIAVGGNTMRNLTTLYGAWGSMGDSVAMAKRLADALGYRLVKKASK